MRDEYDFSKGVRGKYAARAAEGVVLPHPADTPCAFHIYTDDAGKYRWRLVSDAGEVILSGAAAYDTRDDCLSAIESFRAMTRSAPVAKAG